MLLALLLPHLVVDVLADNAAAAQPTSVSRSVGGGWQLTFQAPVLISGALDTELCNYSATAGK
jgi:hypothetical protein